MFTLKRFNLALAVFVIAAVSAAAQTSNRNATSKELSVEESYLQQSIELMTIRETSRVENREMKMLALDYIGDSISRGNKGNEIRETLEYLSKEGVVNKSRENGRVINDYPDVRARAAGYLGELGTEEAKNTLINMVLYDPESMVLFEAVRSLDKIGINDNEETITAISWVVDKFDRTRPDNRLAMAALEMYENTAAKQGTIDQSAIRTINRIMQGSYIKPVKDRAAEVLDKIRNAANSENREDANNSSSSAANNPS